MSKINQLQEIIDTSDNIVFLEGQEYQQKVEFPISGQKAEYLKAWKNMVTLRRI